MSEKKREVLLAKMDDISHSKERKKGLYKSPGMPTKWSVAMFEEFLIYISLIAEAFEGHLHKLNNI